MCLIQLICQPLQKATLVLLSHSLYNYAFGKIMLLQMLRCEIGGINLSLDNILDHKSTFIQKRAVIATDTQSTLKAPAVGPKRSYKYLGINTSPIWSKLWEVSKFVKEIILDYVPGHVGLVGNELADEAAKRTVTQFSIIKQDKVCITLSNLKCYLCKTLMDQWNIKIARTY